MTIPESQLETWSNQGATVSAQATHESIRLALFAPGSSLAGKDIDVYLQGSYRNSTNIRGDSDVDVVVQLNTTFQPVLTSLSEAQQSAFWRTYPPATYTWADFRGDVLRALRDYYRADAVTEGNNSLKLARGSGRLPADVVPALQYREYHYFGGGEFQSYDEGIVFWRRDTSERVVNFPKQHIEKGFGKNAAGRTGGEYKPIVRIFKNARSYLIGQGRISKELAPSYFLECLLYNVPDQWFGASYQHAYCNILAWLGGADLNGFTCQNELVPLFGSSQQQWSVPDAHTLIDALQRLWMDW